MSDLQKLKASIDRVASEAIEKAIAELKTSAESSIQAAVSQLQDAARAAVEAAVSSIRDNLHSAVTEGVMDEVGPELNTAPGSSPSDLLNASISSIQDANTQTDILGALLNGAEKFSVRCGLLVVRGVAAAGWQSRGVDADAFRQVHIDVTKGLSERAIRVRGPVAGAADEFDGQFVEQFGPPADGNVILLPLVVRDRVAALLYADGGAQGSKGLDASGVEVLVRATDLWLEVISSRKAADHGTPATTQEVSAPSPEPPPQEAAPEAETAGEAAPVMVAAPAAVEEDEIHKKAKRFAKLLVDEIKLYNQAKVAEGRQNHDLYDRLKEDIEKSRAAYQKRFGEQVSDIDYFTSELVRILADNNREALGAYPH